MAGSEARGHDGGAVDVRVHLALLFVQVTFGAFHVISKGVLLHLSPLALAGVRALVAAPLVLAFAWRIERVVPRRGDMAVLAGLGMLGVVGNQVLYILGLQLTTAGTAGILMPSIPVFALAFAAALGIERLDRRRLVGVALAVAGALVLLGPKGISAGGGSALGNLLILGNCAAYAAYLVLQRPLLFRLPPLTVVAWAFLFGGVAIVAMSLPAMLRVSPTKLPAAVWVAMAYIILIPTAVNYVLNSWALRRSSPALVATYTTLQPVIATGLAFLFLGETPGARELAGFSLIAAGLAAVTIAASRRAGRRESSAGRFPSQPRGGHDE
jgi:drug/metabolite transporter (DMT)-like permease